jgi:hypothetical protein
MPIVDNYDGSSGGEYKPDIDITKPPMFVYTSRPNPFYNQSETTEDIINIPEVSYTENGKKYYNCNQMKFNGSQRTIFQQGLTKYKFLNGTSYFLAY